MIKTQAGICLYRDWEILIQTCPLLFDRQPRTAWYDTINRNEEGGNTVNENEMIMQEQLENSRACQRVKSAIENW